VEETNRRTPHRCPCPECQRSPESLVAQRHGAINVLLNMLDERSRRFVAALLANQLGRAGIAWVAQMTGLSRNTIRRGQQELTQPEASPPTRIRRPGGGRKRVEKKMSRGLGRP
jgi:DNA-binding phage protein